MAYLMCLIPGALAGAAVAWGMSFSMKHEDMEIKFSPLSSREIKVYSFAAFFIITFIFTPLITHMAALGIMRRGIDTVWSMGMNLTINWIMFTGLLAIIHRRNFRKIMSIPMLIVIGIIVLAEGWLVPLTYYLFAK